MSAKKSAVTKATQEIAAQAQELDNRRRLQITNQIASINRLMEGGRTYDDEMQILHEQLADCQAKLVDAMLECKRLRDLYEPEQEAKVG